MIYLRTIFSAPNEIKFLKLNLAESAGHVDKFIICEFNRTHIGEERKLIFNDYIDHFTEEDKKRIIYIGADISKETIFSKDDSNIAHANEKIMEGYFASQIELNDEDIIFSVDADEIIYRQYYNEIISELEKRKWFWQKKSIVLPLHVFFYRINYLWENKVFNAPIACKAKQFKYNYPSTWRYEGKKFSKIVGAHFSWCLTVDEMITKLNMYAHHKDYGHFAKREILEDAINNKKYPFDPTVDFTIKVLDMKNDKSYFPDSLYSMLNNFKDLIAEK